MTRDAHPAADEGCGRVTLSRLDRDREERASPEVPVATGPPQLGCTWNDGYASHSGRKPESHHSALCLPVMPRSRRTGSPCRRSRHAPARDRPSRPASNLTRERPALRVQLDQRIERDQEASDKPASTEDADTWHPGGDVEGRRRLSRSQAMPCTLRWLRARAPGGSWVSDPSPCVACRGDALPSSLLRARPSHRGRVVRIEVLLGVVLELEQAALAAEPVVVPSCSKDSSEVVVSTSIPHTGSISMAIGTPLRYSPGVYGRSGCPCPGVQSLDGDHRSRRRCAPRSRPSATACSPSSARRSRHPAR